MMTHTILGAFLFFVAGLISGAVVYGSPSFGWVLVMTPLLSLLILVAALNLFYENVVRMIQRWGTQSEGPR